MGLRILRHLKPEGSEGLCYGRTDLIVSADHEAAARAIARDLTGISEIITSPLLRCQALATPLAHELGLSLRVDERLAEIDFGTWEGRLWEDLPRHELDLWADDLLGARPHGGERVIDLIGRVADAMEDATDGTLWVAHAGVYRAALHLCGHEGPWRADIGFGEVKRVTDRP